MRWTAWSVVVALVLTFVPHVAAAGQATPAATPPSDSSAGPRFVLRPADDVDGAYFSLEAEAGAIESLTAVLGNMDDEPLELRTFAADAYTLVNGGFGVREEDEPRTGPATWIEYEASTLTLEPGKGIERTFTISIPDDTPPGQYIAGLVLQTAAPISVNDSEMFKQIIRKSVAVFITVPGAVTPGLELGQLEVQPGAAGSRLIVPVRNIGNVIVRPAGTLMLTDGDGNAILTRPVEMGPIYAGMATTLSILLPAELPAGAYHGQLTMTDATRDIGATVSGDVVTLLPEPQASIELTGVSLTPMPSAEDVQYALVSVNILNRELPIDGVQVGIAVEHDGQPVEEFTLATAVTLQPGETALEQRYIPINGWTPGDWTFAITLTSIDPQTGATVTLLNAVVDEQIVIPAGG